MAKIAYCAGHGLYTPGKQDPNGVKEWVYNNKVVLAFEDELKKYENVQLLRTDDPTGKRDVPLSERTDKANKWNADVYISFHHNALTGKWGDWTGTEVHVYKTKPKDAVRLAQMVLPKLVEAYGLRNRGIKYTNLHITRETKMTAILIEGCFMDSIVDYKKLTDDKVLEQAGRNVAIAVAEFLGLKLKSITNKSSIPKQTKGNIYRVRKSWNDPKSQIGAYKVLDNAKEVVNKNPEYKVFDEKGNVVYEVGKKDDTYIVQKGDTLWGISRKYGMTVDDLKKLNGLKSDIIRPGQKLRVKKASNQQSQPKQTQKNKSSSSQSKSELKVGQKVKIKQNAKTYATGQSIPNWVKGKNYTVAQVKSDRVLLKEILSWVYKKDLE